MHWILASLGLEVVDNHGIRNQGPMTICGYSVALTPGLSVDHWSRSLAVSVSSVIQNSCDEDSHVIDCAAIKSIPTLHIPYSYSTIISERILVVMVEDHMASNTKPFLTSSIQTPSIPVLAGRV